MFRKRLYKISIISIFWWVIICNLCGQTNKPLWINKHPFYNNYYVGIGKCELKHNDYKKIAFQSALEEISSQIEIKIESNIFSELIEDNGIVFEYFRKNVVTMTKNEMENIQIFDSYSDNYNYWVYCRLSKIDYQNKRKKDQSNSIINALFFINKAEKTNKLINALNFYLEAFTAIEKYSNKNLIVEYNGVEIELFSEIYNSVAQLLNNVTIKSNKSELLLEYGNTHSQKLKFNIVSNKYEYLDNIPICIENIKGNIISDKKNITDKNGDVIFNIYGTKSSEKFQIIKAQIDKQRIVRHIQISPILTIILDSFNYPETKIFFNVKMLNCYIKTSELVLNKPSDHKYIMAKVKNILTQSGFDFTDSISDADIMIEIYANSRRGNELSGLFSVFADCSINCINLDNGNEIFSKSINNVRGFDVNYKKASIKSLQEISESIDKDFLNELIEKLKK